MDIRHFLQQSGKAKFSPAAAAGMALLNAKDPRAIKLLRQAVAKGGFKLQNFAYELAQQFPVGADKQKTAPKATTGKTPLKEQIVHCINRPLPRNELFKSAR
ncbi:hypothetical protein E4T85_22425, partial [Bacillus stratosphericus]